MLGRGVRTSPFATTFARYLRSSVPLCSCKHFSFPTNPRVPSKGSLSNETKSASGSMKRVEKPLDYEHGPIVWIDCEMTGLDPERDKLLEIAVVITNGDLEPVDSELSFVIRTGKETLDNMNEWCVKQHGLSGLTADCLASEYTLEDVSRSVLEYVKDRIPKKRVGILAGNTVHMDRAFLARYMPELIDHLHYRLIDVSTIKELCRRWYPEATEAMKTMEKETRHRALDDIRDSIEELRFYRQRIFKNPHNSHTS